MIPATFANLILCDFFVGCGIDFSDDVLVLKIYINALGSRIVPGIASLAAKVKRCNDLILLYVHYCFGLATFVRNVNFVERSGIGNPIGLGFRGIFLMSFICSTSITPILFSCQLDVYALLTSRSSTPSIPADHRTSLRPCLFLDLWHRAAQLPGAWRTANDVRSQWLGNRISSPWGRQFDGANLPEQYRTGRGCICARCQRFFRFIWPEQEARKQEQRNAVENT